MGLEMLWPLEKDGPTCLRFPSSSTPLIPGQFMSICIASCGSVKLRWLYDDAVINTTLLESGLALFEQGFQ